MSIIYDELVTILKREMHGWQDVTDELLEEGDGTEMNLNDVRSEK